MDMKDRLDAFEYKYSHDGVLKFKVDAYAAKLLAEWVAGALKYTPEQHKALDKDFIDLNVEEPGFKAICARAVDLLTPENPDATPALVQAKMEALLLQAKKHAVTHEHF